MTKRKLIDIPYNDTTLSTEMIDAQINDPFIKEMETLLTDIRYEFLQGGTRSNSSFLKTKLGNNLLEKIENTVNKRLGFNIFIKLSDNYQNASVITAPPVNYNILDKDVEEFYKAAGDWFNKHEPTDDTITEYNVYLSLKAMEKALNTKGVIIDRHKAVMKGIPDNYSVYLYLDFVFFFIDMKMSPREMLAVILHELGHAWTSIEMSYRTIENTTSIIESIQDSVNKRNKQPKEALLIAYEKVVGPASAELKKQNVATVYLALANDAYKNTSGYSISNHSTTDSEQLADQFVARFGLADEFGSGYAKYHTLAYDEPDPLVTAGIQGGIYTSAWGMVLLGTGVPLGAVISTVGLALAILAAATMAIGLISSALTNGGLEKYQTYDNKKQRIIRVRNDLVRQIRLLNIDKDVAKAYINQYAMLSTVINALPEESINIADKLYRKLSTKAGTLIELKQIEETIENLMENPLYMSSLKIKEMGA